MENNLKKVITRNMFICNMQKDKPLMGDELLMLTCHEVYDR